jgi:hypothetical protein
VTEFILYYTITAFANVNCYFCRIGGKTNVTLVGSTAPVQRMPAEPLFLADLSLADIAAGHAV